MAVNTGRLQLEKGADISKVSAKRLEDAQLSEELDEKYGYEKMKVPCEKLGWLINMCEADILDENKKMISAVDFYFLQEDGNRFKISMPFKPYFYVVPNPDTEREVMSYLKKKFPKIYSIEVLKKEDLDLHNHLVGLKRTCLKLSFHHVDDLQNVRQTIIRAVRKNKERNHGGSVYASMLTNVLLGNKVDKTSQDNDYKNQLDNLIDIREHDVVYHVRVSIDLNIHVSHWYDVKFIGSTVPPILTHRPDLLERPDPVVLAFDIETTKLPLKFPDAETDNIMMISYMIDGQGFLICNREVLSADVADFEYTPKPEYEGKFEVFNEPDEISLLQRFFDHILDVKPHIFVTYNGDFFDWPFIEKRAVKHGFNMMKEIGFQPDSQGEYKSRQASHMDAFKWVKRDSYLPVGSQNLKAAAKAKLRYDPVELDPEDMCRLASEDPQTMADYSVSDAVATYYMYMKYVHPFIFALCTIIPMEPDSVLRKGSGTLCEALLMVQAFAANIVFPNRHETVLNKLTSDGHVLDTETYVGGHVEALESGVFRSNIPCSFRGQPSAYQELIDGVERTMKFCLEVEEKIPLKEVTNFQEVCNEIKEKLSQLRDNPARSENPVIYHLDVGAMYPNIILTNRLQPSAMVDDETCAACDFNKTGATCQRSMAWMWRGEYMPATRGEYHRIQQQLEAEKFPPFNPGEPHRAFHQLTKEERANAEKKRLQEYCKRAYKKSKVMKMEEKYTTVCQRENSFYVDTVRMFRDRRYEYKAALKRAKKQVSEATASKDPTEIKKAKGLEVLYDSLQLAHKCILNSFYGYVMRKGARWYSMEMAGIVCYTGAHIIMKARELIEQIGRPLELDTDGIWCVLPGSFPENFTFETTNEKKKKVTISYPGGMLNVMVKDEYTNDQYEELIDAKTLKYEQRSENSIFFEVDGPYLAMILPASKEEGKKLKKRYAVFNHDGSLAELKGFEVKRRGELQLIKIFQSSVFEAFLKGKNLEEVYESVARVADYWLDVLYSKAINMPDAELFELVSENRSMSKKLSEYGAQKSTSISTAKRLAEFLGDQMVKDAGLACRFIISKKPEGAPVTERAIPLAIFQSEISVKRHYLRRWTKQSNLCDFDIRSILDWNYYIERLGSAIQKIITIPAALQGVSNPVPRVRHPDWLHKRLMEKNDVFKQKRITDMFKVVPKKRPREEEDEDQDIANEEGDEWSNELPDLEDVGEKKMKKTMTTVSVTTSKRRKLQHEQDDSLKPWKEVLGNPPPVDDLFHGTLEKRHAWIAFHISKWKLQSKQRRERKKGDSSTYVLPRAQARTGLGGFLRQQARSILSSAWQIVQLAPTSHPGQFKLFALIENELHSLKVNIPRIFYVNQSIEKEGTVGPSWRKVSKLLPRSTPVLHLYEYRILESDYLDNLDAIQLELSQPHIEGVYELQTPLEMRAIINLGCVCSVRREESKRLNGQETDTFDMEQLNFRTLAQHSYLEEGDIKHVYIYHNISGHKQMLGIFFSHSRRCCVFVGDTVRTNNMPNMQSLYKTEREARQDELPGSQIPDVNYTFEIRVEKNLKIMMKSAQQQLQQYKDEHHGPTYIAYHSDISLETAYELIPIMRDFPVVQLPGNEPENMYSVLDWQRVAARRMLQQYIISDVLLKQLLEHSRYFHVPLGNLPKDPNIFVTDLFFARHLQRHNHVLWCSPTDKPDLGGKEAFDTRLGTNEYDNISVEISTSGAYPSICLEIEIMSLAINTIVQSHHVNDIDGGDGVGVSFDMIQQASLEELVSKGPHSVANSLASYDDTVLCSTAFRILKSMVQGWLRDVSLYKNELADYQLHNLYNWISSSQSLFHDPALLKLLHNMMKKLFLQLIAEFKRLGSKIVYANFNRLIICTKKKKLQDAQSYLEYIAKSITGKDLFHSIDFSAVVTCWEYLLWLDCSNYGGVKGEIASSADMTNVSMTPRKLSQQSNKSVLEKSACFDETVVDDNASGEVQVQTESILESVVEMHFTLEKYLPVDGGIQRSFELIIGGYISYVHQEIKRERGEILTGETPVVRISSQTQNDNNDHIVPSDPTVTVNIVLLSRELVNGDLMQQLLNISQKISRKLGRDVKTGKDRFPKLPGSHVELNDPTLEFVKAVCHVLSLDPHIKEEVDKLKRNVLRLIGVGEFSPHAEWVDPCASYVLPNLVCQECKSTRDVDLCRDAFASQDANSYWICIHCGTPYNVNWIEYRLLESLQRISTWNVLQDLVCVKCKNVKQSNMGRFCECGGDFKLTTSKTNLTKTLKTFKNIANCSNMEMLLEHVNWLMRK